jgi:hypothetical protein
MLKTQDHSLEGQKIQLEGEGSARAPYVMPCLHSEGNWNHVTADISAPFSSLNSRLIERDLTSEK